LSFLVYPDINAISILENGLIETGSDDKTIKIWKKINRSSLELVSTLVGHTFGINSVILLKNKSLVSGSKESLKVWNQNNENNFECVGTLNQSTCKHIMFASASFDFSIRIWDQITFQCI